MSMAGRRAIPKPTPFLVVDDHCGDPLRAGPQPSKRSILGAVARRSLPHLIEATVIPAGLFYLYLAEINFTAAMAAALCWSYGVLARRLLGRKGVPPILVLASVGLTVRTAVAIGSGSTTMYFLGPIVGTVAVAGVFLGSILTDRPMIGRLAVDFCPLTPEVAALPAVIKLFTGLTVLWAGVNLLSAATTFGLMVTLPLKTFVASKTLASLFITACAVVLTVSWSLRIARREGLVFASPVAVVPAIAI